MVVVVFGVEIVTVISIRCGWRMQSCFGEGEDCGFVWLQSGIFGMTGYAGFGVGIVVLICWGQPTTVV